MSWAWDDAVDHMGNPEGFGLSPTGFRLAMEYSRKIARDFWAILCYLVDPFLNNRYSDLRFSQAKLIGCK